MEIKFGRAQQVGLVVVFVIAATIFRNPWIAAAITVGVLAVMLFIGRKSDRGE